MCQEEWQPIMDFDGYEVSNIGRVRRGSKIMVQSSDGKGYLSVKMTRNGRRHKRVIQRLVAEAFIGPRPDGMIVRHRNGINTDNRDSNLRYGTYADNEADKLEHGTKLIGERHHQAKLTEEQVMEIRRRYKPFDRCDGGGALGREFGVTTSLIYYIVSGKLWPHLLEGKAA